MRKLFALFVLLFFASAVFAPAGSGRVASSGSMAMTSDVMDTGAGATTVSLTDCCDAGDHVSTAENAACDAHCLFAVLPEGAKVVGRPHAIAIAAVSASDSLQTSYLFRPPIAA